ncbi:MAG TPA: hypothetical protein VNH11_21110 [Pirellulales bacterium]|nr:hypothetical protein [Pirellulales bacterium]
MDDPERAIHDLWPEPWEGLPGDEGAVNWDEESRQRNGRTKNPPDAKGKWWRWYFVYHKPTCQRIKISADQDPETGLWFNPHSSSGDN